MKLRRGQEVSVMLSWTLVPGGTVLQPPHLSRPGLGCVIVHDRQSLLQSCFSSLERTIQLWPNILGPEGTDSRDGSPSPGRVADWSRMLAATRGGNSAPSNEMTHMKTHREQCSLPPGQRSRVLGRIHPHSERRPHLTLNQSQVSSTCNSAYQEPLTTGRKRCRKRQGSLLHCQVEKSSPSCRTSGARPCSRPGHSRSAFRKVVHLCWRVFRPPRSPLG